VAIGNTPAAVARERERGRERPCHTFPRVWVETPAPPAFDKEALERKQLPGCTPSSPPFQCNKKAGSSAPWKGSEVNSSPPLGMTARGPRSLSA